MLSDDSYNDDNFQNVTARVAEDDMSSVSMLSADPRRYAVTMQQGQQGPSKDVPVLVFVPDNYNSDVGLLVPSSSSSSTRSPLAQQQEDPAPQTSMIRTDGPLDLSSLEGMVSASVSQLDPELRARLQAIQQLSSMSGPNSPDVKFSMKYTSRLLSKRGDFIGAQVLQDYIHDAHTQQH